MKRQYLKKKLVVAFLFDLSGTFCPVFMQIFNCNKLYVPLSKFSSEINRESSSISVTMLRKITLANGWTVENVFTPIYMGHAREERKQMSVFSSLVMSRM